MYLSKITYSPGHRADMVRELTRHRNLFCEHKMIWNLMPEDANAKRDFLYRKDERKNVPFYYVFSVREPEKAHDFLQVETTEFSPQLTEGGHYGFSLRANAVITRKVDDISKRRIRRDIIEDRADHYKKHFPNPADRPPSAAIHHEAGEQWLRGQGEKYGFQLVDLVVSNHQFCQHKKVDKDNHRQFASLDFDGTLTITDPKQFIEAMYSGRPNPDPKSDSLIRGLGRSKAFGCGLMLIRKL